MTQQVIGIKTWQEFQTLVETNFNLPLINNNFDLLISPFSTSSIVEKTSNNKNINIAINNLSELFEICYCPSRDIENASFFSDLRQINVDNQHALILVTLSKQDLDDFYFILNLLRKRFRQYTLVMLSEEITRLTTYNFGKLYEANHCVAIFSANTERKWAHIIHYRQQEVRLTNKVVQLGDSAQNQWHSLVSMPTYIAEGAASEDFIQRHHFHPLGNSQALQKQLLMAQPAVVVMVATRFSDLTPIAEQAIALKSRFGGAVKIMVRESKPCIRYQDFHFLLNAGIQTIVEHTKSEGQLFDQIQLAYRTEMDAQATDIADLLCQYQPPISQHGALDFARFKTIVTQGLDQLEGTQLEYALVELIPYSSLDVAHAARYCHMRRQGDLFCIADGRLLLFFTSLRRSEVTQALTNVFEARTEDLFAQQHTFTDKAPIIELLNKINHIDHSRHSLDALNGPREKMPRYAQKISWDDV